MKKERFFYDSYTNTTTCIELMNLKEARTLIKDYEAHEEETITILYKDGSIETLDGEYDGHKVSLLNIVSVVDSNPCTFMVYGAFEVNDACVISVNDVIVIDTSIKEVDSWDYSETSETSETSDISEKIIKVGDKISCHGFIFEVAEIIEQEPFSWRNAFHVEFYDTRGDYHFWKQYIDGGFLVD